MNIHRQGRDPLLIPKETIMEIEVRRQFGRFVHRYNPKLIDAIVRVKRDAFNSTAEVRR